MIGVIPKPNQTAVVEEFFQLFKTPWEFFQEGRSYDVVVATADDIPKVDARLLVVYGAGITGFDAQTKIVGSARLRSVTLNYRGAQLPIYNEVLTFEGTGTNKVCLTTGSRVAGLEIDSGDRTLLRVGYDLFREIQFLLSVGQPVENAHIPALEIHIAMLREWMINAGIHFLEIPPVPAGHPFVACLTHDIDFVGIRRHKFDHTMWGFVYRATLGTTWDFMRGRTRAARLFKNWQAVLALPLVYLGWVQDFWHPFDWYLQFEKNLPSTYFLIPFKNRAGDRLSTRHPKRRAASYDISDIPDWTSTLIKKGCEIGVHGIDAWNSIDKGREELRRVASVTGKSEIGVRMHWLLYDEHTFRVLDEAGYAYDSTVGYNETIGYRCGTAQVFRPLNTRTLVELPIHIQDGALFFPQRLGLSESEAWRLCEALISSAKEFGGALTIIWHDRSPGPERFWGDFYVRLVGELKSLDVWFGTAAQVTDWFRKRRNVTFERVESLDGTSQVKLRYNGAKIEPPLILRVHRSPSVSNEHEAPRDEARTTVDFPWTGETDIELRHLLGTGPGSPSKPVSSVIG